MQSYGLTASQVNQQLRQVNVNAAGGRTEIAGSEQAVRVLGNAENAYQHGETRLSIGDGRTIRLADVARVTDGYAEQRHLAKNRRRQVLHRPKARRVGRECVSTVKTWLSPLPSKTQ